MLYCTTYDAGPFGEFTLAGNGHSLCGLWMDGQKYFAATAHGAMERRDDLPIFEQAVQWLDRYFAGEAPNPVDLALAPCGSPFRQRVWRKLLAIPYGQVRTYRDIAQELAVEDGREHMSAQAVGGAVGHNPISLIIPCHRVIGANGSLTGYAGGVTRKMRLLEHEGVDISRLFVPTRGTAL